MMSAALTRSSQRLTSITRRPGGAVRVSRTASLLAPTISSTGDFGSFFRVPGDPTAARMPARSATRMAACLHE